MQITDIVVVIVGRWDMTSRATIEHSTTMSELYAKVIFNMEMTIQAKDRLENNWKDFKDNVEEAIKNIKGVDYTK